MNKYVRAQIAAAILAGVVTPALAAEISPYVEGFGGYAIGTSSGGGDIVSGTGFGGDFGSSGTYGGGVGLKLPIDDTPVALRFDLTGSFVPGLGGDNHTGTLDDGTPVSAKVKLSASTYLATGYIDFDAGLPVVPYVGFGIGGAHKKIGTIVYSGPAGQFGSVNGNDREGVAWSGTVGVTYHVIPHFDIDAGYRYIDAGKVNSGSNFTDATNGSVQGLNAQISSRLQLHQFNATLRYLF